MYINSNTYSYSLSSSPPASMLTPTCLKFLVSYSPNTPIYGSWDMIDEYIDIVSYIQFMHFVWFLIARHLIGTFLIHAPLGATLQHMREWLTTKSSIKISPFFYPFPSLLADFTIFLTYHNIPSVSQKYHLHNFYLRHRKTTRVQTYSRAILKTQQSK